MTWTQGRLEFGKEKWILVRKMPAAVRFLSHFRSCTGERREFDKLVIRKRKRKARVWGWFNMRT